MNYQQAFSQSSQWIVLLPIDPGKLKQENARWFVCSTYKYCYSPVDGMLAPIYTPLGEETKQGGPKESIVQNHLNIALLNVF